MRSEYSPYLILLVPGLIFVMTLIMLELGRRMGLRRMTQDPEGCLKSGKIQTPRAGGRKNWLGTTGKSVTRKDSISSEYVEFSAS